MTDDELLEALENRSADAVREQMEGLIRRLAEYGDGRHPGLNLLREAVAIAKLLPEVPADPDKAEVEALMSSYHADPLELMDDFVMRCLKRGRELERLTPTGDQS